jgi:hypothetical protein
LVRNNEKLNLSLDETKMNVDESWEARVCMNIFSTLMVHVLRPPQMNSP